MASNRLSRPMIDAVIFDCDGVLVDSEILAIEVETSMLAEAGLVYDIGEFKARFMGLADKAFYAALERDSLQRLGRSLPLNFAARCSERLRNEVRHRIVEVAGARACVAALKRPKAVASSTSIERLRIKLGKVGLWDLFAPHVYSADHVTHAKPAPDLFLHAAKALDVRPETCLVLEDSVNGVLAGKAAGMTVWGFAGGGHMDEAVIARLEAAGAERILRTWPETSVQLTALFAATG